VRVAVTGAGGRLGRALVAALADSPFTGLAGPLAWTRAELDLDDPEPVAARLDAGAVEAVVHAAAWTDVDGCARDPDLAHRRNGDATGVLARACAARGTDLVIVSTNEVFDGRRRDGRGYEPGDPVGPINSYGRSKLAGERAAVEAYATGAGSGVLAIVRTAWLYGPPGNDFPAKILAAAHRARAAGEPLKLVGDETGSPTYTVDLAEAIAELLGSGEMGGTYHVVNAGAVSRAGWAREVLRRVNVVVRTEEVPAATWPRASTPPLWAVLEPSALPSAEPMRPWQQALADYVPFLVRGA